MRSALGALCLLLVCLTAAAQEASWGSERPLDPSEHASIDAIWHGADVAITANVPFACGTQATARPTVQGTRIVIDVAPIAVGGPQCMHSVSLSVAGPARPIGTRIALVVRIGGRPIARGRVEHTPLCIVPPPHRGSSGPVDL